MELFFSLLGLFLILVGTYLTSENRAAVRWRTVIWGVALQGILGLLILRSPLGRRFFEGVNQAAVALIGFSNDGASFLFGPHDQFAFRVLPTIIFVSSLSYVMFHLGVLQKVVGLLARLMRRTMGVSGVESLGAAANIFLGQTEAPLLIRPYLVAMTRSEVMCLMTGGMATVAGGVLAAYVSMGISAGHLLAASLMSAPAGLAIAKLLCPETETSQTAGSAQVTYAPESHNLLDAACLGARDGLMLCLNVGAMLLAIIALVAMLNGLLGWVCGLFGFDLTLQQIAGYAFAPVALLTGVPWNDCFQVGQLYGTKIVLNEFVAYLDLAKMVSAGELSERAQIIATYGLCGFANFSSVAIQIGGLSNLAPSRRKDYAALALKSMWGGVLAALMTACVAGLFL